MASTGEFVVSGYGSMMIPIIAVSILGGLLLLIIFIFRGLEGFGR